MAIGGDLEDISAKSLVLVYPERITITYVSAHLGGEWIKLLIQNLFPCFLDREEMRNVVVAKSNEVSEKWNWDIYSGIH